MKIVIYIENGSYGLDFIIPYEIFSYYPECEVYVVSKDKTSIKTLNGVEIMPYYSLEDITSADVIWLTSAKQKRKEIDPTISEWLKQIVPSARLVIGLGHAVYSLVQAGLIESCEVAIPEIYKKTLKKSMLNFVDGPFAFSDKFITAATSGEALRIALKAIEILFDSTHAIQTLANYELDELSDFTLGEKAYRKIITHQKKAENHHLKQLTKPPKKSDIAVVYLFKKVKAIDVFSALATLAHLPVKTHFVANQRGLIDIEGSGFAIDATDAIQSFKSVKMLFIPGGKGINLQLKNTFLMHWLSGICAASFRVLCTGRGEQLVGLCGALKDIDNSALEKLDYGEGKYIFTKNFITLSKHLSAIAKTSYKPLDNLFVHYWTFSDIL